MSPLIQMDTLDLQFDPLEPTRSLLRPPWRPPWSTGTSYTTPFSGKNSYGSMDQNQVSSLGHLVLFCFWETFKYTTDPWLSKWPICVKIYAYFCRHLQHSRQYARTDVEFVTRVTGNACVKKWAVVKLSRIDGKNTFFLCNFHLTH